MRLHRWIRILMFAFAMLTLSAGAFAQFSISVAFGPPELPVYEQPLCPGEGYLWTPGYWAWDTDGDDYFWVPGTWVLAPEVGYLWTPPYWGWEGTAFFFHEGYWGREVGFYGGISYGFGYFGRGYEGGRWDHDRFFYNREVNNINVTNITNVYNERITINNNNRVSYNGHGGVDARPSPHEESILHGNHLPPVAVQTQHIQGAKAMPELRASANHGKPPIAATPRPTEWKAGAVPAKSGGNYNPPPNRGKGNSGGGSLPTNNPVHPRELPPINRPAPPNTGDTKRDQKYQQQQDKLIQKQTQDREKLQAQQEKEHAKLAQQNANEQRKQQVEQKHSQQTQQLVQRHTEQVQHMQTRQTPPPAKKPK